MMLSKLRHNKDQEAIPETQELLSSVRHISDFSTTQTTIYAV